MIEKNTFRVTPCILRVRTHCPTFRVFLSKKSFLFAWCARTVPAPEHVKILLKKYPIPIQYFYRKSIRYNFPILSAIISDTFLDIIPILFSVKKVINSQSSPAETLKNLTIIAKCNLGFSIIWVKFLLPGVPKLLLHLNMNKSKIIYSSE